MPAYTVKRRHLLAGAASLAATAGIGALSGCSSTQSSENTTQSNTGVKLPDYLPYKGVEPDLAGTDSGVRPAFYDYPSENPKSVTSAGERDECLVLEALSAPFEVEASLGHSRTMKVCAER